MKPLEYTTLKTFKADNTVETESIAKRKKQLLDKALDEQPELRELAGHWDKKINEADTNQPCFSRKKTIATDVNYSLKLGTLMPKRPSVFN